VGDARVALRAVTDLANLRTAIIAAYDKEAARTTEDPGNPADESTA